MLIVHGRGERVTNQSMIGAGLIFSVAIANFLKPIRVMRTSSNIALLLLHQHGTPAGENP